MTACPTNAARGLARRNARRRPGDPARRHAPKGVVVAFSGRGHAPEGEATPTPFLARRLSGALGLDGLSIHWARQVHGDAAVDRAQPRSRAGRRPTPASATRSPPTAPGPPSSSRRPTASRSCWPAPGAVGAAHAGWRGSAKNVAAAAVRALRAPRRRRPRRCSAWIGPSIGPCCYEVGGEVAAQFAGDFVRAGCGGGFASTCARSTSPSSKRPAFRARRSPSTPPARSAAARSSRAIGATARGRAA